MWLRFSPDRLDGDAFTRLEATDVVSRAKRSGLHYIELRMAYGEFWEVTQSVKPRVDALIDAAAKEGIGVIAWTVPRAPSFDDLTLAVAAANYRTPRGTRVAGLAIDLERGPEYMGEGVQAFRSLADYPRLLRQALGPSYLIVSTVDDPFLAGLTNRDVPFRAIARYSNALQPMTYWRMFQRGLGPAATRAVVSKSILTLRREAGVPIPINVGGQTLGLGSCGSPLPQEIVGSLSESRQAGAIGETFFDWFGTLDGQWDAIASFNW